MSESKERQHTPLPWALRSSGLIVGNINGNVRFIARLEHTDEQGWRDGSFLLRAATAHRDLVQEIKFAVANGGKWTLEDWRNWIEHHAKPVLAVAEKES